MEVNTAKWLLNFVKFKDPKKANPHSKNGTLIK
jgi:hypothetical protein